MRAQHGLSFPHEDPMSRRRQVGEGLYTTSLVCARVTPGNSVLPAGSICTLSIEDGENKCLHTSSDSVFQLQPLTHCPKLHFLFTGHVAG